MSQPRLFSGKIDRHEQAIKKYQNYENSKTSQAKLNDMIQGKKTIPLIAKPGEFITVATNKPVHQQLYMDIPIKDLLDEQKNFSELRMQSIDRMNKRNTKIPKPKNKYDDAVLLPEDNTITEQIDEFGIETIANPQFTQSIRQIMKKQHKDMLVPSDSALNDAIHQHLPTIKQSQTQQSLLRPISATYILKKLKIEQEQLENSKGIQQSLYKAKRLLLESAKPRNLYIPHVDLDIKHLQGYQTIALKADAFVEGFAQDYKNEKEQKSLEKHFQTSAIDPRLQSPFLREDKLASLKIQQQQDRLGELALTKHRKEMFMAEPHRVKQIFLPLDFYYIEEEYGEQLIKKYGNEGLSKWFDTKGGFVWEDVEVIRYIYETDQFEIKYLQRNKTKLVTRINIRFRKETNWEEQMKIADLYRRQSEIFIKYNYMIDQMSEPTSQMTEDQINRIQILSLGCYYKLGQIRDPVQFYHLDPSIKFNFKRYLIPRLMNQLMQLKEQQKQKKFKTDTLAELIKEVKAGYIRGNRECMFRRMLPFSEEKISLFKNFLPDEMFDIKYRIIHADFPSERGVGQQRFIQLFETCKTQLHQANPKKLSALQSTVVMLQRLSEQYLFHKSFTGPLPIEELDRLMKYKIGDAIRDFKTRMYDIHYEIMEMVETEVKVLKAQEESKLRLIVLEAERKLFQEQGLVSDVLTSLKQFQKLITLQFERSGYEMWIRSITILQKYLKQEHFATLEQVYQQASSYEFENFNDWFLINIEFSNTAVTPDPQLIVDNIKQYITNAINELLTIPCMRTREIESAREDQIMHLFESPQDEVLILNQQIANAYCDYHLEALNLYFEKLREFEQIFEYNIEKRLKKGTFDEYAKELDKLNAQQAAFQKYMFKKVIKIGIFNLNIEVYRNKCFEKLKSASDQLYENLIQRIMKENQKIEADIKVMTQQLKTEPNNLEELNTLRIYAKEQLITELSSITRKIDKVMDKLTLMDRMNYQISYENFSKTWSVYGLPLKLMIKQEKCLRRLQNIEKKFQEDLMNQQAELKGETNAISNELDQLILESDTGQINKIANKFAELGERIERSLEEAEIVNRREIILKWKLTDFSEIDKMKKIFIPYYSVWGLGRDYYFKIPSAQTGPLNQVDVEVLSTDINEAIEELHSLERTALKKISHMITVSSFIRKLYEDFIIYLPLMSYLRSPCLKKVHWVQLHKLLKVEDDPNFSLTLILDRGAMDILEDIREISERAQTQNSFEKVIQKMKQEWKSIKFELEFYTSDCCVLRDVDPIIAKLKEDIIKSTNIATSPVVEFLAGEVNSWKSQLVRALEMIELWCRTQILWKYQQPIFSLEELTLDIPKVVNKFLVVDDIWKQLMMQTQAQPIVMEACFQTRMKENFTFMLEQLDQLVKLLNDYLNKKRNQKPILYFLNKYQIIEILFSKEDLLVELLQTKLSINYHIIFQDDISTAQILDPSLLDQDEGFYTSPSIQRSATPRDSPEIVIQQDEVKLNTDELNLDEDHEGEELDQNSEQNEEYYEPQDEEQ